MKFLPELAMPSEPVRPAIPWSLAHLRVGLLATAALAVVGSAIAGFVVGVSGVYGVLLGLAIVAAFFSFGSWAVARLGQRDDRLTFPAALGSYLVKIVLLGLILISLPIDGPINVKTMAVAVVVGTLVWAGTQMSHVLRAQIYYVDYQPPTADDTAEEESDS